MNIEESVPDSMVDRIANQFEPLQPEAEEQPQQTQETEGEAEAQAQPEFVEVEFKGKKYQVPPELKDGLMAESDYTTKTQEVAEKRRLIELKETQVKARDAERAFEASCRDDITALQRIDFQIEQYKSIPVASLTEEAYRQLRQTLDQLADDRAKHQQKLNEKYQGYQQDQLKLAGEAKQKALEAAQKSIPNWSPESQKQIRDFAVSAGFEDRELDVMGDPRVVKVLWQASQYQKLQAAKLNGKVTTVPAVKPGSSNPMPQHVKDNFAFKKEMKAAPSSSAKSKVIERELMRRF